MMTGMAEAMSAAGKDVLVLSDGKKTLDDKKEEYLDSLSEGKDFDDDYGSKVDALVDSMGVTAKEVSTTHRRKDLDLL